MVEVKRRKGETGESLMRRFSQKIQQSGILLEAKKFQYRKPDKNKPALRKSALHRLAISEKREYLRKTGQLDELYEKYGPRYKLKVPKK